MTEKELLEALGTMFQAEKATAFIVLIKTEDGFMTKQLGKMPINDGIGMIEAARTIYRCNLITQYTDSKTPKEETKNEQP